MILTTATERRDSKIRNRHDAAVRSGVRIGMWLTLVIAAFSVLFVGRTHTWTTGDTAALVKGNTAVNHCLGKAIFWNCNHYAATHHLPLATFFPLLQSGPVTLLSAIGLSGPQIIGALQWVNDVAILGSLGVAILWCYRRSGTPLAVVGGLLLIPGMLVAYSVQTFSEPLAAAFFVCLVVCALRRDRVSPYLLPLALLSTITKETSGPFVVAFGVSAIALSGAAPRVCRGALLRLASGAVLGELLNTGFNLFKYGTILNHPYLSNPRSTGGMVGINFVALLISPDGGVIWFWPAVGIALLLLVTTLVRTRPQLEPGSESSDPRRLKAAALIALLGLVLYLVSLSFWWDPMGWYSWGPRLVVPVAAPLIVLSVALAAERGLTHLWFKARVAAPLCLVSIGILVPTFGASFGTEHQSSNFYATWGQRPECVPQKLVEGSALFESCQVTEQWRLTGIPLIDSIPRTWDGQEGYWLSLVCASCAVILSAVHGRLSLRVRRSQPLAHVRHEDLYVASYSGPIRFEADRA